MHDDRPLALLDNVRQHAERRRDTRVPSTPSSRSIDVHLTVSAGVPCNVRGVDCVLYIRTVEVDELLSRARETEDAPGNRPLLGYAVDVESGVQPYASR